MMVDLFTKNFWLAIGTWVVLYCLDYGLTLVGAKLYRSRGSKHYSFSEGYELNPVFKEDIARLRVFSFRFLLLLILSSGLLAILYSANFPPAFVLAWGALVGVQLSILHRHIRNLALFFHAHDSGGISGRIEIKHWLSLRLAGVEYFLINLDRARLLHAHHHGREIIPKHLVLSVSQRLLHQGVALLCVLGQIGVCLLIDPNHQIVLIKKDRCQHVAGFCRIERIVDERARSCFTQRGGQFVIRFRLRFQSGLRGGGL